MSNPYFNRSWLKSKYGNQKSKYGGKQYDSKMEAMDAVWLDNLLSEGKIEAVESQHKISLDVSGHHIANHFVDFLVTLPGGRQKFVETKGFPTDVWVMKRKLVEALYPEIPYLTNTNEKELLS